MIDRVTRNAAVNWPNTNMARTTGFSQYHVFVLGISDLADGCIAVFVDFSDLARRQPDLSIPLVARHEGGGAAGGADHLGTSAGDQLNIMNRQANGDRTKWQ